MKQFLATATLLVIAAPAMADDFNAILFSHSVEIYGKTEETMHLDGKPTITDGRLTIDEIATVAGIPTLVGNSFSGGASCEGSPSSSGPFFRPSMGRFQSSPCPHSYAGGHCCAVCSTRRIVTARAFSV